MVGNLLPDFTKQISEEEYSAEIIQGVKLHRFIDTYTDAHPIVQQSKERISSKRRRFSPILIDIFYDHFLAIHWEQYSSDSLLESTQSYYRHLAAADMSLPLRLTESIQRMPKIDLLFNYSTMEGMEDAVNRVSQRIRFKNNLYGGVEELENNFADLEADFHLFFMELQDAVADYKERYVKPSF